jgi:uncharacterized membrane protein YphA (DoxX/SURF4 family)
MMAFSHALSGDEIRRALADVLRLMIGVVWLVAAVQKLRGPTEAQDSVRRLMGGPSWAISFAARALPLVEILLGLALLAGWQAQLAAALSAAMFLLFAFLVVAALVRNSLDGGGCGCFGTPRTAQYKGTAAGVHVLARNLVLAAIAVAAASGS